MDTQIACATTVVIGTATILRDTARTLGPGSYFIVDRDGRPRACQRGEIPHGRVLAIEETSLRVKFGLDPLPSLEWEVITGLASWASWAERREVSRPWLIPGQWPVLASTVVSFTGDIEAITVPLAAAAALVHPSPP